MIWIVSFIGAVLFLAWFKWWDAKPVIYKDVDASDLERFFTALLSEGHERAVLFIEPMTAVDPKPFVQFAKYGTGQTGGIRFAFPNAAWSRPHFSAIRQRLSEAGFPVLLESTGEAGVPEFAVLNLGNNIAQARRVNEIVLSTLGYDTGSNLLRVWFQGVFSRQS